MVSPIWLTFGLFLIVLSGQAASPFQTWHPRSPTPTLNTLNGVAYGKGRFVAVGDGGVIVTSTNGIDWNHCPSVTGRHLNTVVFANERFVAGGDAGTFLWSDHGVDWTNASIQTSYNVTAIGYGKGTNLVNGLFVALASSSSFVPQTPANLKLTSLDGTSWVTNLPSTQESFTGRFFRKITFGNDRFVASTVQGGAAVYSETGTNWATALGVPQGPITFGNGLFVNTWLFAIKDSGVTLLAEVSADGYVWRAQSYSASVSHPMGLCFGGGRFVVVGERSGERTYTGSSMDGTNWLTQVADVEASLRDVEFGMGLYVAVGDGGTIVSSEDGLSWTRRNGGTGRDLYAVAPWVTVLWRRETPEPSLSRQTA